MFWRVHTTYSNILYQYIHNAQTHTHTHKSPFPNPSKIRATSNVDLCLTGGTLWQMKNLSANLEDPEKEKEKECQWILPPGGKLTVPNSALSEPAAFQKLNGSTRWVGRTCASEKVWKCIGCIKFTAMFSNFRWWCLGWLVLERALLAIWLLARTFLIQAPWFQE